MVFAIGKMGGHRQQVSNSMLSLKYVMKKTHFHDIICNDSSVFKEIDAVKNNF